MRQNEWFILSWQPNLPKLYSLIALKKKPGEELPPPALICYFVLNVLTSLSVTPPFPSLATTFQ